MLPDGTVSLASSAQQPGKAFRGQGLYPESPVHIVSASPSRVTSKRPSWSFPHYGGTVPPDSFSSHVASSSRSSSEEKFPEKSLWAAHGGASAEKTLPAPATSSPTSSHTIADSTVFPTNPSSAAVVRASRPRRSTSPTRASPFLSMSTPIRSSSSAAPGCTSSVAAKSSIPTDEKPSMFSPSQAVARGWS